MKKEIYNILIVDDDSFVVEWMEKILGEQPQYRIYSTTSAQEAMKIIRNTDIQVILSDICMPEIDGLQLLKYLRKLRPNCQVVFLTGYSDFDYIYEATKYEGVRYILKIETDQKILNEVHRAKMAYEKLMGIEVKDETLPIQANSAELDEYVNQSPVVMLIKKYIEEHLDEDLQLTVLAEHFHFNPSYLSRLFKSVIGVNLSDYIFTCRMEESEKLLGGEYIKIEEVAHRVGYQSAKSFSRLFKRFKGITPQEYRKSIQSNSVKK